MTRYIIRRIIMIIPVVLLVAVVIFTIMYFTPGDPATIILGSGASAEELNALRESMGLNQPYIVQLGSYMYDVFIRFDLGNSYTNGIPIAQELVSRFSVTLVLALSAILIEIVVGIPLGMVAARHRGGWLDQLCMLVALVGISVPAFWLGFQLLIVFSLNLGWLPSFGVTRWQGWILPIFVNSLRGVATMARQARSSTLEVIRSDYVTTARAKGLPEGKIMSNYVLPNALIPLIQTVGSSFGQALGGTVIIENVFSIPGIGQYIVSGIATRDYAVIRSTVIVLSIAFSLIMLLVDVGFGFVDPRIKAQYAGKKRLIKHKRGKNAYV